ncbi:hypothetical protein [Oceanobacillus alkalisoli]|nr:hypothetical protein [Oceanobacillus alkalisoli]MCF3943233.1 hypothetical protein [Oceanobacillus alkalisoli]MCG5103889.1 hypothetical protein [Oceanobacillus alkalisoli]
MNKYHKMSVAEYESNLANRMKVERKREQEYQKSKQMIAEIDNQIG